MVDLSGSNPYPFVAEMQARQGKRALPTGSLLCVNDPRQAQFDTVLRRIYATEFLVEMRGVVLVICKAEVRVYIGALQMPSVSR